MTSWGGRMDKMPDGLVDGEHARMEWDWDG